jgi:multidrug resistance protein, MATE family
MAIMAAVPWCLARAGQDPALVGLSRRFIPALLAGYLPSIAGIALRLFLIASNDLKWLNPIIITGTAFNVACNVALAGGAFGLEGLTAVGIAISLTNWLTFGLLVVAVWHAPRFPKGVLDRRAGLAGRDTLALGIPVGAIFFTEVLLFTGSSLLMSYFGKVALAAHGIVLLWLNIALMVPIGISQAAMARVAFLLGQRDLDALKHAVAVSLLAGSAASIAIGALLVAGSDGLVRLAMWSRSAGGEAVVETARGFFRFCAATQLLSGLVIVMASILRGLRDANAVLWLVMLGYWGVGIGGAVLFGFGFGLGGTGIWLGITLAFVFAVCLLAVRFFGAFARLGRGPA